MDQELSQRLATLEQKIDSMYATVEKLRLYFFWTGVITVALFILPLIGLAFVIPSFLNTYANVDNLDTLNSLVQ